MPSKKKKYNSRFPPARIKKIMQMDDEVGKVAAVVPVIISRALELFVETLLKESRKITISRNARTLTPSHLKASTLTNSQFSFLKDMLSSIPDIQQTGEDEQSDVNLNSGPSASGVKAYRRTNSSKSNHSSSNNNSLSRGRGRPKKSVSLVSQTEEENEEEEETNDTMDDEEEENDDDGSSCDNSNCNAPSSPRNNHSVIKHLPSFDTSHRPATEDDDYDA